MIKVKKFFSKSVPIPEVSELLEDEKFQRFVGHSIVEYERTGQLKHIRYFLNTFADTPYFCSLIHWMCARLGLEYTWPPSGGEYILTSNPDNCESDPDLATFLTDREGNYSVTRSADLKEIKERRKAERERLRGAGQRRKAEHTQPRGPGRRRKSSGNKKKIKKKGKIKKRIDAMWRRLPGSFGSGRR